MKLSPSLVLLLLTLVIACGDDAASAVPASDMGQGSSDVSLADAYDASVGDDAFIPPMGIEKLFAQGAYDVGYVEFEISYTPPGATEARVLPVKAWYPAVANSGVEEANYAVAGIISLDTEFALDAPDAAQGDFPVAFYSHGSGGEGLLAYPYAENFASWGWVVVSPNHVGNTALDGIQMNFAPFAQNTLYRVTDVSAVLDAVERDETNTAIDGRADTERVFLFGHSFGGYTTLAAGGADFDYEGLLANCATYDDGSCEFLEIEEVGTAFTAGFGDDRIDAIAPQAPALVPGFAGGQITAIDIPTMIQSGDKDITTTNTTQAQPAWDALDGEKDVWVRMPDGAHLSFITICDDLEDSLITTFQPTAFMDGCGEGFIPVSEAVPTLNAYLRAFSETHVLGASEWQSVLDGSQSLAEGFNLTKR